NFIPPNIDNSWGAVPGQSQAQETKPFGTIALDGVHDKIVPGTWVAISRPVIKGQTVIDDSVVTFHKVVSTQASTLATVKSSTGTVTATELGGSGGFSAKVTQLVLDPPWLQELLPAASQSAIHALAVAETPLQVARKSSSFLHRTVVYAQAELL